MVTDSCSPGDGSSVRIILWMCGGCCYNSHLSPRGLVPAFTLKHTSPSLWLLLSIQDACYTENLILYYWQMTKNVIEIEQVKKSSLSKMQSGTDEDRIISPHFLHYVIINTQNYFFLNNCQGSKLLSPLILTVNCVSFLLENSLPSFATHVCLAIPVSSSSRFDGHLVWTLVFSSCPFNGIQMRAWITPSLTSTFFVADWLMFSFKIFTCPLFWRSLLLWWEFVF